MDYLYIYRNLERVIVRQTMELMNENELKNLKKYIILMVLCFPVITVLIQIVQIYIKYKNEMDEVIDVVFYSLIPILYDVGLLVQYGISTLKSTDYAIFCRGDTWTKLWNVTKNQCGEWYTHYQNRQYQTGNRCCCC